MKQGIVFGTHSHARHRPRVNPRLEEQYIPDPTIPLRIVSGSGVGAYVETLPLGTEASVDLLAGRPVGARLYRGSVLLFTRAPSEGAARPRYDGTPAHIHRRRA